MHEEAVRQDLEKKWQATLKKLPMKYHADFIALRDDVPVGLVELKIRDNDSTKYPTYMLSLHKASWCMLTSELMNIPFVLVVCWNDITGYVQIKDDYFKCIKMQEVNLSRFLSYIEPCIHIPIKDFKQL